LNAFGQDEPTHTTDRPQYTSNTPLARKFGRMHRTFFSGVESIPVFPSERQPFIHKAVYNRKNNSVVSRLQAGVI
jgi:hypothetical protein